MPALFLPSHAACANFFHPSISLVNGSVRPPTPNSYSVTCNHSVSIPSLFLPSLLRSNDTQFLDAVRTSAQMTTPPFYDQTPHVLNCAIVRTNTITKSFVSQGNGGFDNASIRKSGSKRVLPFEPRLPENPCMIGVCFSLCS
jgi:hypothetical protein